MQIEEARPFRICRCERHTAEWVAITHPLSPETTRFSNLMIPAEQRCVTKPYAHILRFQIESWIARGHILRECQQIHVSIVPAGTNCGNARVDLLSIIALVSQPNPWLCSKRVVYIESQ